MSSLDLDLELNETVQGLLQQFLMSLGGGFKNGPPSTTFLRQWLSFKDSLPLYSSELKQETLETVNTVASTIDIIASATLELDAAGDVIRRELAQDISMILNDDIENLVIRDEFPITTGHGTTPPYIRICSEWLLANLHNPYPPKSIQSSICRQTGSAMKDLDAWFADARKRIGWNDIRRTHFSNRREKIIDAAISFFKPSHKFLKLDSSIGFPSCLSDEHSMAFVEMEERAKDLFVNKFKETRLARTIDHVISNREPLSLAPGRPNLINNNALQRKCHAYPSPERSPERSPEPRTPTSIGMPSPILLPIASHKRRRSESHDSTDDISPDRLNKRPRPSDTRNLDAALAAASLPSPVASLHDASSPAENGRSNSLATPSTSPSALPAPPILQISTPAQTTPSAKRKRCFSDSDSQDRRPSKYLQPTPLSRISSNPLPISNDLSNELVIPDILDEHSFNQSPDTIPSPNFRGPLDDSIPLEVTYYQYPSPESSNDDLYSNTTSPKAVPHPFQEITDWSALLPVPDTWAEGITDNSLINTENLFCVDTSTSLLLEPDFLQFSQYPQPYLFKLIPATFDWTTFVNQPSSSGIDSETEVVFDAPVSTSTPLESSTTELVAKRRRAEVLRAELKKLDADLTQSSCIDS